MIPAVSTDRGEIYHCAAEDLYPQIEAGSVSLLISDGPYNLRKAAWDTFDSWGSFVDWYRPHVEAWDRVCAASSTVYVWGTDESETRLRDLMRSAGWSFRGSIVWDKGIACMAGKMDVQAARSWYEVTERCGVYQREAWAPNTCAGQEIAYAAGRDDRNWIRLWLGQEWSEAGLRRREADQALGTNGMAGHYFGASQWSLPTWENYQTLAEYAQRYGVRRARPYLVHPSVYPGGDLRASYDHLRAEYDHLRAEYDHLRAEYERSRPAFYHPIGVGNVWSAPQVAGLERLKSADGRALHPCQKPVAFYDRIIRASSRPGELILEPFGGTCRTAIACERLDEARRYLIAEPDLRYVEAVSGCLQFQPAAVGRQQSLF